LDWQLDLLDHTQIHTITVYTLHNSLLQLQLFWHPLPSLTNSLQPDCSLNSELVAGTVLN
jgi:hypothetical protein